MSQHSCSFAEGKLYLVNVSFSDVKKEILVEFANKNSRVAQRFKFFPFLVLSEGIDASKVMGILLDLGIKGFEFAKEKVAGSEKQIIRASSFNELKRISNALASVLQEKPLTLEPERAFLLQNDWSYFDEFVLDSLQCPVRVCSPNFSEKDLGFFIIREVDFKDALKLSEQDSLFLVERAVLSALLCVPMHKVPQKLQDQTELFLENLFFRNGAQVSWGKGKEFFVCAEYAPLGFFDSVSSIDFSFVWAQLFAHNFFNLGADTANCGCCAPITLSDKNLYPSSLVEVEFKSDNFFFESFSHSFSQNFHKNKPFKENRLAKRKEFFMKSFPVGPFFRGDKALILAEDAKQLLKEDYIALGSKEKHELHWFCTKKEGFLSKECGVLFKHIFEVNKFLNSFNSGLFESKPFGYYFASALSASLSALISELPFQLMSINSKFFSLPLARNVLAVQEATMHKFRAFSEQSGYRVLHADNRSAFIKGFSSLRLAKSFAKASSLPQPQIRAFSKQTKISQMV